MGIKSIVIIVLAMFVVLLVGYLLGQRRRNPSIDGNYVSSAPQPDTHAVASVGVQPISNSDANEVALAKVEVISPKPKPRDYSKQIIQVKEFHENAADVFADLSFQITYSCFIGQIGKVNRIIEVYEIEKQRNEKEAYISFIKSLLDAANFSNIQRGVSSAANEIAKLIIQYYDDQVSMIFTDKPFSHLTSRYALNADLRETQITKISGIICGHFSHVISELKEFEQIRNWLQANFHVLASTDSDDVDWGSFSRLVGSGFLAGLNPLIGIPAAVASYATFSKNINDKAEKKSAQKDQYVELLLDFLKKYDVITDQVGQCECQTAKYVSEKFSELNVIAIPTILTDITANGYEIDYYIISLKKTRKLIGKHEKEVEKFVASIKQIKGDENG
ncbi:hypothetical protein [Acidithiobacillus sulfurivorans]|uniref:Uncharacterized protein n=1 Tax=Acidithiobacillus sulfurivorans TaxID=1958756 RepID=A0ABS6A1P4_9PROT|nr:hypothetical protein [Acidithiobacillus sulfurivorans]MBU2760834.1 hypothetical protein [Acidithiobacillus sulfurivorans]